MSILFFKPFKVILSLTVCCAVERVSLTRTWRRMSWVPLVAQQPGRRSRNHPYPSTSKLLGLGIMSDPGVFVLGKHWICVLRNIGSMQVEFSCIFCTSNYLAGYPDSAILLPDYLARKAYPVTTNKWMMNLSISHGLGSGLWPALVRPSNRYPAWYPDLVIVLPNLPLSGPFLKKRMMNFYITGTRGSTMTCLTSTELRGWTSSTGASLWIRSELFIPYVTLVPVLHRISYQNEAYVSQTSIMIWALSG